MRRSKNRNERERETTRARPTMAQRASETKICEVSEANDHSTEEIECVRDEEERLQRGKLIELITL